MTEEELKSIEDRANAAIRGPWVWRINLKSREVNLEAQISGLEFVMGFNRWGMASATVVFQKDGFMRPAENFAQVIPKREHHSEWCQTLSHPDADFIAHARQDIPALIAEVRRLKDEIAKAPIATNGEGR